MFRKRMRLGGMLPQAYRSAQDMPGDGPPRFWALELHAQPSAQMLVSDRFPPFDLALLRCPAWMSSGSSNRWPQRQQVHRPSSSRSRSSIRWRVSGSTGLRLVPSIALLAASSSSVAPSPSRSTLPLPPLGCLPAGRGPIGMPAPIGSSASPRNHMRPARPTAARPTPAAPAIAEPPATATSAAPAPAAATPAAPMEPVAASVVAPASAAAPRIAGAAATIAGPAMTTTATTTTTTATMAATFQNVPQPRPFASLNVNGLLLAYRYPCRLCGSFGSISGSTETNRPVAESYSRAPRCVSPVGSSVPSTKPCGFTHAGAVPRAAPYGVCRRWLTDWVDWSIAISWVLCRSPESHRTPVAVRCAIVFPAYV